MVSALDPAGERIKTLATMRKCHASTNLPHFWKN
jgi:hypothetical protein